MARAMKRIFALLLLLSCQFAIADDFKPAYLQLKQIDENTYEVMWKLPALDENTALKIAPRFPAGTKNLSEPRSVFAEGMAVSPVIGCSRG